MYNKVNVIYSPEELVIDITRFFTERSSRKFVRNLKDLFFAQTLESYLVEMKMFKEQFEEYYAVRDMKRYLHKLNSRDPLCSNINEINSYFLEYTFAYGSISNRK